jgi:hypothetical protein
LRTAGIPCAKKQDFFHGDSLTIIILSNIAMAVMARDPRRENARLLITRGAFDDNEGKKQTEQQEGIHNHIHNNFSFLVASLSGVI